MSLTILEYSELRFITDLLATAPAGWEGMLDRRLRDETSPAVKAALEAIREAARAATGAAPADRLLAAARKLAEDADALRRDAGIALFGALSDHEYVPELAPPGPRRPRLRSKVRKIGSYGG